MPDDVVSLPGGPRPATPADPYRATLRTVHSTPANPVDRPWITDDPSAMVALPYRFRSDVQG
ncbi:hypothetical protein QFZ55_004043 [Streptomyces luteogriseus]|nr:hypothetical protein [Streptomyces luteogriseus]